MVDVMSKLSQARALRMSEACIECFFQHRTADVGVDELAAAAGVSRRTFHRYFESKEAAIRPVLEQGMDLMATYLASADEDLSLADALVAAFEHAADGNYRRRTHQLIPLLNETDGMRAVWAQAIADGEQALTAPIAERLSVPNDARVAAAVVTTLVRMALLDSHPLNSDPVATFSDYLERVSRLNLSTASDR